jgi:copper chaperone
MSSTSTEITLDVEGMTCGSCVGHVEKALRAIDGVAAVQVQLGEGKVVVSHDPAKATLPAMIAALDEEGYRVQKSTPTLASSTGDVPR